MTMTKSVMFTAIAAIAVLVFGAQQVFAFHAWTNANGDPYHWARTTESFTLPIINNHSNDWNSAFNSAVSDWTQSSVIDLAVSKARKNSPCISQSGKVVSCNAAYGATGWLGIAQISITGGEHITQGLVALNDTYYNMPQYNSNEWRTYVTCQEIGHTLGLGHNDEDFSTTNGTCMDYTNDASVSQHPDQHDFAELAAIYAHLDDFNSYAADSGSTGGNGGGKGNGNGGGKGNGNGGGKGKPLGAGGIVDPEKPDTWGQTVAKDAQDNPSVYVRNLENGNMVVTHVTWADDHEGHDHTH